MPVALRSAFTPDNSGATTRAASLTVPAGVVATDVLVFVANFITGTNLTATLTTSGAGVGTQLLGGAGFTEATSAQGFLYRGRGFVAGDTITITPNILNRVVATGAAWSGASYEQVSAAGASSTTVANCPGVTTVGPNALAVAVPLGVASASPRSWSSVTGGWAAVAGTFVQGGSSTRFHLAELYTQSFRLPGTATGAMTATASAALLGSVGAQVILAATGPEAPTLGTRSPIISRTHRPSGVIFV